MSKPPSNGKAQTLPPEVLAALERWWFEEHLSFPATTKRLLQEFGLTMTVGGTMSRLHERMASRRERDGNMRTFLGESMAQAKESLATPGVADGYVFFQAGLIQIGALIMKLTETASVDPDTVEGIKGLFGMLTAGFKELRGEKTLQFEIRKYQDQFCEQQLDQAKRAEAERIANSELSHADKIAALRQTFFADIDALQASGAVVIPK